MVDQAETASASSADQFLQKMPCEPANILAIAKLLGEEDPSLPSFAPFFEQDFVLSLKVISAANELMKGRSTKAIAVRNVRHALSIIGFNGIQNIIEQSQVSDTSNQSSLYFQVYRFTLVRTQFLLNLIQAFSPMHPSLNVDDVRLYTGVLMFSQLHLATTNPIASNTLFLMYQREVTEFWSAEMELLETTLVDKAVRLTQHYCLPRENHLALELMPGLEQFFYSGVGLNLKKIHRFFRKKAKEQDIVLSVVMICYTLVHRSPPLWGDKRSQFLVHWLGRFLNRSTSEIWKTLQHEYLKGAKTYPLLDGVGRSLVAQHWPAPTEENMVSTVIEKYAVMKGISETGKVVSLTEARSQPVVESLAKTVLTNFPEDDNMFTRQVEVKSQSSTAHPKKKVVADRDWEPGEGLERFIKTISKNPSAYGAKLPTSAALLETLRIGLDIEFCVVIFFDEQKQHFWVGNVSGLASRHPIRKWMVPKEGAGLLQNFIARPAGVWIQGERRQAFLRALPKILVTAIGESEAFISTITSAQRKPTGLVIAVARPGDTLSKACYQAFQKAALAAPL